MNKRRFDLKKLVLGLVNDFQNKASVLSRTSESSDFTHNNLITKFSYLPNEEDLFVNADEERITEVLLNLLDNAVKFTKGGHITVTIANDKDKNQLSVSVKDTGVGVHPQMIPRLFTKFASKSSGGTGLGLFISKSIIEAHGGNIWFQENSSDRGCTFGFTIPLQEEG